MPTTGALDIQRRIRLIQTNILSTRAFVQNWILIPYEVNTWLERRHYMALTFCLSFPHFVLKDLASKDASLQTSLRGY